MASLSLPSTSGKLGRSLPHDHVFVYRDSPEWAKHSAWFLLPHRLLRELYVCTYHLGLDSEGWPVDADEQLARIETDNPGCVFVY